MVKLMKRFFAGDKVFAKVRGYPPWPAKVSLCWDAAILAGGDNRPGDWWRGVAALSRRLTDRDVARCGDVNYSKVAVENRVCCAWLRLGSRGSRVGARKARDPCRMRDNVGDNPPSGTSSTMLINARRLRSASIL